MKKCHQQSHAIKKVAWLLSNSSFPYITRYNLSQRFPVSAVINSITNIKFTSSLYTRNNNNLNKNNLITMISRACFHWQPFPWSLESGMYHSIKRVWFFLSLVYCEPKQIVLMTTRRSFINLGVSVIWEEQNK